MKKSAQEYIFRIADSLYKYETLISISLHHLRNFYLRIENYFCLY